MRKRVFEHMRTAKAQISLRIRESDQGLHCPLIESLDTIECINGEQQPGWDFAHARTKSDLCVSRMLKDFFFPWRGPCNF